MVKQRMMLVLIILLISNYDMRDCITLCIMLYNGLTIYRSHKLNYSKLMQLISINVNKYV